jgi:hypothetical protein
MRLKLLLAMLFVSGGLLMAQDTIKTLIISEARMDRAEQLYFELTNVGDEALDLSNFEFTCMDPWQGFPEGVEWPEQAPNRDDRSIERLPAVVLAPGESYVIGAVSDFTEENYARDLERFGYSQDWGQQFLTNPKLVPLIDLRVYQYESPGGTNDFGDTDSISESDIPRLNYGGVMEDWGGRSAFFIRHHISPTDSAVIDQVGGTFDDPSGNGTNPDGGNQDVAGVTGATGSHYLIRRFDVKQGNTEFVRGTDLSNSEWIPIPRLVPEGGYGERLRGPLWTVGNHQNTVLTDLTTDVLNIDWAAKTIEVPWGVRNNDSIMGAFNYTPGIAWHYDFAPNHEDSAFVSVRTGDLLTLFALGNTLDSSAMTLNVLPPTTAENRVVPKYMPVMDEESDDFGTYVNFYVPYEVTDGRQLDTISEIPYATRVDTLQKYLEKPPLANWEIVWVDGNERTDLMEGDLLRVTAEDGASVKDYYLDLQKYRKGRNDYLSSITWPDIPEFYKGLYGWVGDTIPGFASAIQNYVIEIPADTEGIPGLVGKPGDDNASVDVQRAVNLFGSTADRTVTFTVTAENDTSIREYTVEMVKQKATEDIQPWLGEPFMSQFIFRDHWSNTFLEVVNPGTGNLDLSEYMFYFGYATNSADAITSNALAEDFDTRYEKYIPGRIWADTTTWAATPGIAVQDLNVNTVVFPGDVFVMGDAGSVSQASSSGGYGSVADWPAYQQTDIFLTPQPGNVPDDEKETALFCPWDSPANRGTTLDRWVNEHIYLFKIIGEGGDSVRNGLKPATDPFDFELIDVWGSGEADVTPSIGGVQIGQIQGFTRKPEIYAGNTEIAGSWGDTINPAETTEWIMVDRPYFNTIGVGWPMDILRVTDGLGSHFMNEVTVYKSTVASSVYKVSQGYSMEEEIRGATTGTTVAQFLANLSPADTAQGLTVISGGVEISGDAALTDGDSLVVVSADLTNTSRYYIEVTADGLSDDAVLTSDTYTITTDPAEVTGFEIGTPLADVAEGVNVPAGAIMNIIDANDAYVPLKTINFDTLYVDVLATSNVWFEVVAEDGATTITYQLMPNGDETDAYVTSAVFAVDQGAQIISLIPDGTTVDALLANLVPATGASWVLLDKLGFERTEGMVVQDDQLVVTAADGVTTKTYFLSMLGDVAEYLAYVVSDVYTVDQDMLTISGADITATVSVTDFLANLTPAIGATMEVQDNTGTGKAGADMLAETDQLEVIAANGVNMVIYAIELNTVNVSELGLEGLSIYPNPTAGQFYIEGLEPGLSIKVYNAVGVTLRNITAFSSIEQITLDDQPNGMYYITISNDEDVVGRYKVIKQ